MAEVGSGSFEVGVPENVASACEKYRHDGGVVFECTA